MTAANRWGDARKALTLFRQAGETVNERAATEVTRENIDANLEAAEQEAVTEKRLMLPFQHMLVLSMLTTGVKSPTEEIQQPVSIEDIRERYESQPMSL